MTQQILDEVFHLTDDDPNVTEADGTASVWSDIWKYQTPVGTALRFTSAHTFSAYLEDASAEVGSQTARVRIQVRDPAETENIIIFGESLYLRVKEFQERPKKARLGVAEYVLRERHWVVISVYDDGAIDASDSYFDLTCERVRGAL